LLSLVHAANAVLLKTIVAAGGNLNISHDLAMSALRAKAAAAKFFVILLQIGRGQALKQQMLRESSSNGENLASSEGAAVAAAAAGEQEEANLFLNSMRAVDVENAAYISLRQITGLRDIVPVSKSQDQEFVALLALTYAMRGTLKLMGNRAAEELDGTSGILEGVMRLLEEEFALIVPECSKSCVTASQGWGIRWLGFRAAGWLCGAAPTGIPLPNFRMAPCFYIMRELCSKNHNFASLLFDTVQPLTANSAGGPLPTKLFGAQQQTEKEAAPEKKNVVFKYVVLRGFVELFSLCLTCVQKDADFAYAAFADACLDTIIATLDANEAADLLERVGDLSLAFNANLFVLENGSDRVLTRLEHRGCFVDQILRLITDFLSRPLSLHFVQIYLKCVRAVRSLVKLCSFQSGPDSRINVDWKALFNALLRVVAFSERLLKVRQRKINVEQDSSSSAAASQNEAANSVAMMEGTVERNQLLSLTCETLELVCEGLCVGNMFANIEAVQGLWYEVMRNMDSILFLAKILEPEYVVDSHSSGEQVVSSATILSSGIDGLFKQVAELFNDAKTKAAKEGKEIDQAGAIQLAENCRHQFLALRPDSAVGAGAEHKHDEFLNILSACSEERRSQYHQECAIHPIWLGSSVDPHYEQSISTSVQSHVSSVFQPVDK